jgi:hypothetical protein
VKSFGHRPEAQVVQVLAQSIRVRLAVRGRNFNHPDRVKVTNR